MPVETFTEFDALRLVWSKKQWDEFESRSLEMPLSIFNQLVRAVGLVVQGTRLNATDRTAWVTFHEKVDGVLTEYLEGI